MATFFLLLIGWLLFESGKDLSPMFPFPDLQEESCQISCCQPNGSTTEVPPNKDPQTCNPFDGCPKCVIFITELSNGQEYSSQEQWEQHWTYGPFPTQIFFALDDPPPRA